MNEATKIIEIHGFKECGYCKKAKELASNTNGYNVEYIMYPRKYYTKMLSTKFNKIVKTAPYVLFDGVYIGGFTELKNLLNV